MVQLSMVFIIGYACMRENHPCDRPNVQTEVVNSQVQLNSHTYINIFFW